MRSAGGELREARKIVETRDARKQRGKEKRGKGADKKMGSGSI